MNYKMYSISVTDLHSQETDTKAYFKANVAYSTFKRIIESRQYMWRNCLCREGDSILIAESVGGDDYLIELYEHELLKLI